MSSRDGLDMESWINDSFFWDRCPPQSFEKIVAILEPCRVDLEYQIADFDEDTQSWRDYRNAMWDCIPKQISVQIDNIIQNPSFIAPDWW